MKCMLNIFKFHLMTFMPVLFTAQQVKGRQPRSEY
jgi:hypothetical protein